MQKVGKTTRPFRYDLNKIPYDYTVELKKRKHCTGSSDKIIPKKKKCKKAKWLSEEALQIAEKRKQVKEKGEKERLSECRVPKNIKERSESFPKLSMQRNKGKQQVGKDQRSLQEN